MNFFKNKAYKFIFVLIIIFGLVYIIDKVEANREINPLWIKEFMSSEDNIESKNNILQIVLEDIKYNTWENKINEIKLNINESNILGNDEKELILTIFLEPKKSIIVVYKKDNNSYKYVGIVDKFFDIQGVQTIPIDKKNRDIIVVREFVDQMLGAFEQGTYIRAYIWEDEKFEMVLSVIEDYSAYWNEMWDKEQKIDPRWLRIMDKASIQWENGPYPVLKILENQSYAKSTIINSKNMPKEDEYEVISSREVLQEYYWSDKYNHFILSEGKNVKTGETIAIIEDLSLSPFELAGFKLEQYRIKTQDGKIEIVPKNQIIDIKNPSNIKRDFYNYITYTVKLIY
ncbi:hypothetical protein [Defluviitalea phaphyphila]|uniref:hypothetical protein n=1 Tax=Defluviitalea phaphyphila TaxID=1473580 RepID=UPI000730FE9D|nr:hypothetical protein [Defluviitalea phaphyphila]